MSIALAALIAGGVLGFVGGRLQASTPGTRSQRATVHTAVLPVGDTAIGATGNRCAVQLGRDLQLGIEIINQSAQAVALRQVRAVLPLGGLRVVASQWRACGALPEPGAAQPATLAPGATRWLTATFAVLAGCPQALPVWFRISYTQAGAVTTGQLDSFPDLGQVRYDACGTAPAGQ